MKFTIGRLNQKASWFLEGFVFGCIFIITIILFLLQRAEAVGDNLTSTGKDGQYFLN